jgi:diguanylate cyclase (GGDEF)-like protein
MKERTDRRREQSQAPGGETAAALPPDMVGASLAPFAAAAALAALATPIATTIQWSVYVAAVVLGALAGVVRLVPIPGVLGRAPELLPSAIFLGSVALLRSSAGGANAGIAIVALLPVFWTALHGDRRQLCLVVAAAAAFFFGPLVLVGGPEYPISQYRGGVLFVAVSAIVGFTTQGLVGAVRSQAREAVRREYQGRDLLALMTDIAITDPLTGLPNRRAWETRLHQALLDDEPGTLAMLDFDRFKAYNDAHGHPAGDRLLRETAAGWRDELRVTDLLARIGGDEFSLLLPDTSVADATAAVERLRRRVPYAQSCSAGIVERRPGETADSLIARADAALYRAKTAGRDRSTVAS